MTLGNWDPNTERAGAELKLDRELLQSFVELSQSGAIDQPNLALNEEQVQIYAGLMTIDQQQWMQQAEAFSNEDIEALMRFFTKAEQLPGWDAGPNCPVIWLGKILKQRGWGISRDLTLWIKAHSNNRFLPHGPLL